MALIVAGEFKNPWIHVWKGTQSPVLNSFSRLDLGLFIGEFPCASRVKL